MRAVFLPLTIYQGATFLKGITWRNKDTQTLIDLSGATARMQVRADIDSPTVLLELTTENGGITLGGVTGVIALEVSATDTAAIGWEAGVYDLEIVFANGTVRRLVKGDVIVDREVTRV